MSVLDQQAKLIARYQLLPDPQERLNALIDRAGKLPHLPDDKKIETYRIRGCQSRAWVVGIVQDGLCHFSCDAESLLVKGLLYLICSMYDGGTLVEVIEIEPDILQELGIWQILSPTRQNGLTDVRRVIREWARHQLLLVAA